MFGGGGGGGSLLLKLKSLVLNNKEEAKPIARSLPDELFHEIFKRLPVKSTLTCKCVTKTWFSIISDPDFVKLQLNYTLKFNDDSRFILSGYDSKIHEDLVYITEHSLFSTTEFYDKAVVTEKHHPLKSAKLVSILGSFNGLVCLLHHSNVTEFCFSLWNPATKEYKRIPDSPYSTTIHWPAYFCYGYKNDDYKLVSARTCRGTPSFLVYVYTLRSNSWKTLETKPYSLGNLDGILSNGAVHWISQTPKVIVSFNISDETFEEMQHPGELMEKTMNPHSHLVLKVLEGCLCVILLPFNKAWVMREYGVWESWTEHQNKTANKYKHLKWSSENGECLIYSEGTDLVLYGPKHSGARRLKFGSRDVYSYIESLVSLNSGIYLGRKEVIRKRRRGIWRKVLK
ncbi:F-box/kelch-repeat protein At3g06240-like [Papaver somniferum]|uniref:F-box/kelch-repeat protein At3g06240-like n=1 Tax=Papaver somniferum TaxID=3469 RepID=UPI000E6FE987|nr:F-box/kelch-repeat protein At3g06240-like [Papaver somniferum]